MGDNSPGIGPPASAKTPHSLLDVTLDYNHLFKYCEVKDKEPLY